MSHVYFALLGLSAPLGNLKIQRGTVAVSDPPLSPLAKGGRLGRRSSLHPPFIRGERGGLHLRAAGWHCPAVGGAVVDGNHATHGPALGGTVPPIRVTHSFPLHLR